MFSGEQAFALNDTYGFPLDLTKEILSERGMTVDEERFRQLMQEQRERARSARKDAGADAWKGEGTAAAGLAETAFTGYSQTGGRAPRWWPSSRTASGWRAPERARKSLWCWTPPPSTGRGGGQVGDNGSLEAEGVSVDVIDTTKHEGIYLHRAVVESGTLNLGDKVTAKVDGQRRRAIMRNHTAAHLLQAALRKVLGDHVEQAGQLVNDRHVRFDFTHFSALTPEELAQVELLVNEEILKAVPVSMVEMPIEEARQSGAMALFGEKYGDVVRVVSVEDGFSKEFCGGTHMDNTARLGLFKILSETSVASGVRRIEGVTGMGVLAMLASQTGTLLETARAMKVLNPMELPLHARQTMQELKDKDREIETLNAKLAQNRLNDVFQNAQDVDGVKVVYALLSGTGPDALRALCDKAKEREEAIVAVFAGVTEGKATLAASCNKAAQDRGLKAGVLVKGRGPAVRGQRRRPARLRHGRRQRPVQAGRRFGGGGWAGAAAAGVSSRSHKKESALRAGRSFRVI